MLHPRTRPNPPRRIRSPRRIPATRENGRPSHLDAPITGRHLRAGPSPRPVVPTVRDRTEPPVAPRIPTANRFRLSRATEPDGLMHLDVIGAGPAYTDRPGATGASYLLRNGDSSVLLDLGH